MRIDFWLFYSSNADLIIRWLSRKQYKILDIIYDYDYEQKLFVERPPMKAHEMDVWTNNMWNLLIKFSSFIFNFQGYIWWSAASLPPTLFFLTSIKLAVEGYQIMLDVVTEIKELAKLLGFGIYLLYIYIYIFIWIHQRCFTSSLTKTYPNSNQNRIIFFNYHKNFHKWSRDCLKNMKKLLL